MEITQDCWCAPVRKNRDSLFQPSSFAASRRLAVPIDTRVNRDHFAILSSEDGPGTRGARPVAAVRQVGITLDQDSVRGQIQGISTMAITKQSTLSGAPTRTKSR